MRALAAILLTLATVAVSWGGSLDVYQGVVLTAQPDRPAEVKSYIWLIDSPDRQYVPVRTEAGGRVARFMDGSLTTPGLYRVFIIAIYGDGSSEQMVGNFTVGPAPDPDPDPPGPEPGPDPPDPPNPGGKWQVLLWIESDDLDNLPRSQQEIVSGRVFRDELAKRGHYLLGVLDYDSVVEAREIRRMECLGGRCQVTVEKIEDVPDDLKLWHAKAAGDPMPWVVVAPKDGGTLQEFPLPPSAAEFFTKLEGLR